MLQFKSDKLVGFSLKLAQIHRAALPNAIRNSLTEVAKDVKQKTLRKNADRVFDVKKRSFFSKFSGYKPAKGFNISRMFSIAGMTASQDPKSKASAEIGAQEYAGSVKHKTYWASQKHKTSRGLTKKSYRDARNVKPITTQAGKSFFKDAVRAKDSDKPLLIRKNGKGVLVKVKKIRKKKGVKHKKELVTDVIAGYEKGRSINLKTRRPFLSNAAKESGRKLEQMFIKHAQKQIKRFTK